MKNNDSSASEELEKMSDEVQTLKALAEVEEILVKEVKAFGRDGAHITGINPNHVGKKARVIIQKKKEGDESH